MQKENGVMVANYTYDTWGNLLTIKDEAGNDKTTHTTHISQLNPFRYRGYFYDKESGLYYLKSRYYSPEWGRFINGDGLVSTGQGQTSRNMFTYCLNNPVNMTDSNGFVPAAFASNPAQWYTMSDAQQKAYLEVYDYAKGKSNSGGNRVQAGKDILVRINGDEDILDELVKKYGLAMVSDIITSVAVKRYRDSHNEEYPIFSDACISYEIGWHVQGYLRETKEGYEFPKYGAAYKALQSSRYGNKMKPFIDRCSEIDIKESDYYNRWNPFDKGFGQAFIFDYKNGMR